MGNSAQVPVYINCRDRLRDLRTLVAWLERAGQERLVLIDNDSTYEPLREFYASCPHTVVRLRRNYGSRALFAAELVPTEPFVYTDPDIIPCDSCPLDAVAHLSELLDRYPAYPKAALGLYLDDVPETMDSLAWERSLVSPERQLAPGAFDSLSDTTFALYRPEARFDYTALRTGAPYQARHLSPDWYGGELTDEDRYYLAHAIAGPQGSSWAEDWER